MDSRSRSVRHQRIRSLFDPAKGNGLEIGPLFDPVVDRDDGTVRFVDVHSAERLRADYSPHPGLPLDDIVDPDFVLIGPDGPRPLPTAVGDAAPFDWVIASHVIEHVPDVLGWLAEVAAILADDGRLVLAVPDRRFSFDADRAPTTVGEMLLAHERGDLIPSVRAIYDHYSRAVILDAGDAWAGRLPDPPRRIHGLDYVQHQMRLAREDSTYIDCHVWLFTPQSLVDQFAELAAMGLLDFVLEEMVPTPPGELEFYLSLRRLPRALDGQQRAAALATGFASSGLDDTLPALDQAAAGVHVEALSPREWQLLRAKRAMIAGARTIVGRLRAG